MPLPVPLSANLSGGERVRYWSLKTPQERIAAGWKMTVAHYKALGSHVEGQGMQKNIAQLRRVEDAKRDNDV